MASESTTPGTLGTNALYADYIFGRNISNNFDSEKAYLTLYGLQVYEGNIGKGNPSAFDINDSSFIYGEEGCIQTGVPSNISNLKDLCVSDLKRNYIPAYMEKEGVKGIGVYDTVTNTCYFGVGSFYKGKKIIY